ncbi:hypothetical protein ABEX18_17205 [Aneurinibacillus migulanus]|nr:hypothetical protein [Aneurinibacillus migulanus]MED0893259.1 hypothetical protein [Aneurinibacillus migulanus]MED1615436.1 hypothetical protein [Aneurinibacillus migulanus]GED14600.1 hypothetical protein AMI01nite_25910 [Aneurinibacillus migulanus]
MVYINHNIQAYGKQKRMLDPTAPAIGHQNEQYKWPYAFAK